MWVVHCMLCHNCTNYFLWTHAVHFIQNHLWGIEKIWTYVNRDNKQILLYYNMLYSVLSEEHCQEKLEKKYVVEACLKEANSMLSSFRTEDKRRVSEQHTYCDVRHKFPHYIINLCFVLYQLFRCLAQGLWSTYASLTHLHWPRLKHYGVPEGITSWNSWKRACQAPGHFGMLQNVLVCTLKTMLNDKSQSFLL